MKSQSLQNPLLACPALYLRTHPLGPARPYTLLAPGCSSFRPWSMATTSSSFSLAYAAKWI